MSQANQVEIRNEDRDSWNAWADERINSALEQHQNFVSEVTGEALGEISAGLREEFRKELEAVTGKLGVELRELIAGLRIEFARLEMELAGRFTSLEKETTGLHLRGTYRSDQDYDRLDVVTLDGSSYIARQDGPKANRGPQSPAGASNQPATQFFRSCLTGTRARRLRCARCLNGSSTKQDSLVALERSL
jgi:hypothetical protein